MKKWINRFLPNPLDKRLKQAKKRGETSFLIVWNRGLGDIPLGLYALCHRIRQFVPAASITFLTRLDLKEGLQLLSGVQVLAVSCLKRKKRFEIDEALREVGQKSEEFEVILDKLDPTRTLSWQLGTLVPKLSWDPRENKQALRFGIGEKDCIGVHFQTETSMYYGYEKNWPRKNWNELFRRLVDKKFILFGLESSEEMRLPNVIDLRGKTSLFEMLAIVQQHCQTVIAPDSGVLNILFYLDVAFQIKVISLWADPRQGIMRQNVSSPNPLLTHIPLIGKEERVERISVDEVVAFFS